MSKRKTRDAIEIIRSDVGADLDFNRRVAEEKLNARIARMAREARQMAGLTQGQLAERIGSTQPNIARFEDADYEGHSLSMLRRIAEALGLRLDLSLVPDVTSKSG